MRNSSGRRRPNAVRRPSITSRRKATLGLEPGPFPGRFLTPGMCPVSGAWAARQVMPPQVAAQQLQAAVRGQLLGPELDVQRALDRPSQARYAQTHQRGLLCVGSNVGAFSLSIAQGAFLLPIHDATQYLF